MRDGALEKSVRGVALHNPAQYGLTGLLLLHTKILPLLERAEIIVITKLQRTPKLHLWPAVLSNCRAIESVRCY
jgi:hypothetical protein